METKKLNRKYYRSPIKSVSYTGIMPEDYNEIIFRLNLKAENPSKEGEYVSIFSWERNDEEILLERGYGISFHLEVEKEVEEVILSLGYII